MSKRKKKHLGECAYGPKPATMEDHVPPRGMFAKSMPNKPWVPVCESCNGDASKDDEYMQRLSMLWGRTPVPTPSRWARNSCGRSITATPGCFASCSVTAARRTARSLIGRRPKISSVVWRMPSGIWAACATGSHLQSTLRADRDSRAARAWTASAPHCNKSSPAGAVFGRDPPGRPRQFAEGWPRRCRLALR